MDCSRRCSIHVHCCTSTERRKRSNGVLLILVCFMAQFTVRVVGLTQYMVLICVDSVLYSPWHILFEWPNTCRMFERK